MKNEINESVYDINMDKLCQNSIELIKYARNITAKQVNNVQIMTYYSLGRWIVEVQQQGKHRAEYGKKIIINLSKKLTEEFGKGFSESTLEKARKFYLTYKDRISETLFTEFANKKSETVFTIFEEEHPFVVTWSHYLQLMRIENEDERSFYEIEAAREKWGVRDLNAAIGWLARENKIDFECSNGEDCWIGGGAILCPGVKIGHRCIIGAGSVVTKDIPDNSVAVGNPAKVIRKVD